MNKSKQKINKSKEESGLIQQNRTDKKLLHNIISEKKLIRRLALIVSLVGFLLYMNTLNHEYALDDYTLIVENTTTQKWVPAVTNNVGLLLVKLGRNEEAETYLRKAIQLQPDYFNVYISLVKTLKRTFK